MGGKSVTQLCNFRSRQGKWPILVFKSALGGWEQDQPWGRRYSWETWIEVCVCV